MSQPEWATPSYYYVDGGNAYWLFGSILFVAPLDGNSVPLFNSNDAGECGVDDWYTRKLSHLLGELENATVSYGTGECLIEPDGKDTNGDEWSRCVVHDELVFGDAYICERYVPKPYDPFGGQKHRYYEEN